MIADFVTAGVDCGQDFRMGQGAVPDEEENGFGVVALQGVQDLRCEVRMRAIVERKCHERNARADAVDDVGRDALGAGSSQRGSVQNAKRPNSAMAPKTRSDT